MKHIHILLILILTIFFTNCNVIRPGRVGVKQRLGKLDNKVYKEGIVFFNPFVVKVIKASIQTNNLKLI